MKEKWRGDPLPVPSTKVLGYFLPSLRDLRQEEVRGYFPPSLRDEEYVPKPSFPALDLFFFRGLDRDG
jgi:hypothetical protein